MPQSCVCFNLSHNCRAFVVRRSIYLQALYPILTFKRLASYDCLMAVARHRTTVDSNGIFCELIRPVVRQLEIVVRLLSWSATKICCRSTEKMVLNMFKIIFLSYDKLCWFQFKFVRDKLPDGVGFEPAHSFMRSKRPTSLPTVLL